VQILPQRPEYQEGFAVYITLAFFVDIAVEFEDRAVAFIDVLGFKSLVDRAAESKECLDVLSSLVKLLSSAVLQFDATVDTSVPQHLVPRHLYISDSIILSTPLADMSRKNYDGLAILVMRVIQISHLLLKAGYLLRCGISVGKVWHTTSNIVGPAYQEAFMIEHNGKDPIVVLSTSAAIHWKGGSRMCLEQNNVVFVNSLFDHYIPNISQHGVIEQTYARYDALANQRLLEPLTESAKEKWYWFREFLRTEAPNGMVWAQDLQLIQQVHANGFNKS